MKPGWITNIYLSLLCASLALALAAPTAIAKQSQRVSSSPAQSQLLQFTSSGHILGFTSSGIYAATGSYALRVDFVGASSIQPQASGSAEGKAPPLDRVLYPNIWRGISLAYDAPAGGILHSTYQLKAGTDVSAIQLRYNAPVEINRDGSLTIAFESGTLNESAPLAWQVINGKRVPVAVSFTQYNNVVGFALGQSDARYPLTIDPTLTWHTFIGGNRDDYGNAIALDGSGNIYVAGESYATWGSPVRAFTNGSAGEWPDAYVAKLNSSGVLQWHTFLGGSGHDYGKSIVVGGGGNIFVGGSSDATWDSPVRAYTAGSDAFAAKLNSSGVLQWHTFLGGSGGDSGLGIALDGDGNPAVVGSSDATWASPVRTHDPGVNNDAFTAKIDSNGALQWNTFLGGSFSDNGWAIAVDGDSNIYVGGSSDDTWGSPVRDFTDGGDAFAVKLDPSGALQWNTFLGGSEWDIVQAITADGGGNVFVAGHSNATWGTPVRAFTYASGFLPDAFAAKLNSSGALQWHTFLGGGARDYGRAIVVDGSGYVTVAGYGAGAWGCSPAACTMRNYSTYYDAFTAQLDPGGALLWNAFLGGSGGDYAGGTALDGSGYVYMAGYGDASWGAPVQAHYPNAYHDTYIVTIQLTTGEAPAAFTKSDPTNGSTGISTSPTLSWGASNGTSSYEYCYDTTNDNVCASWNNIGVNTSIPLNGLSQNTTYYWHVRAINSFGATYANGNSSAYWSFTTGDVPGAFALISPANEASGISLAPTLSWGASSGTDYYEYCYDTSNDYTCSSWTSNGTATSKALSGLSLNTTYYWHVRAVNAFGTTYSAGSTTAFWSFTTLATNIFLPLLLR